MSILPFDEVQIELSSDEIDKLAAGYGDITCIKKLASGQYDQLNQWLTALLEITPEAETDDAVELLNAARLAGKDAYRNALQYPISAFGQRRHLTLG